VLDYRQNAGLDVIEYLVLNEGGVVDLEVLANLLEFARITSSEVAALAAERRSDEDLTTLGVVVAKMQSEKNSKYSHLLQTLWVSPGSITQGYEYVVDAVRTRDVERARSLVKWIWTGRHQRFVEAVEKNSRPPSARTG
jgi:DNA-binding FadR family transcriptional regulator